MTGEPEILVPVKTILKVERELRIYREALEWIAGSTPSERFKIIEYAEEALSKYPKEAHDGE
jgi:hypothetical protein